MNNDIQDHNGPDGLAGQSATEKKVEESIQGAIVSKHSDVPERNAEAPSKEQHVMRRWVIHVVDILVVLALTGLLAWTMKFDPFQFIVKVTDFNSTDFYDRVAYVNNTPPISKNVVIVGIDSLRTRGEVGELIMRIAEMNPAAIGLDVMMVGEFDPEGEAMVLEAIDAFPEIILPISIDEHGEIDPASESFYLEPFPDCSRGVVTFTYNGENGIERFFAPEFVMSDGSVVPSMGLALARAKDADAAARFMSEAGERERLNFNIFEAHELYPHEVREDLIEGKVVLIGDLENPADFHNTSINGRLPGIKLLAAVTETILEDRRIADMPDWIVDLFAFVLVAIIAVVYSFWMNRPWYTLLIMGIKLIVIAMILFGGYWLYSHYDITIDFTYTVALLGFGILLCDVWFNLTRWLFPWMSEE